MGKRFLSVETNACAIQSVYQPYFFCTPPIGRQTGLAAVGTLSAVTYVTYFVASSSLFVFEQFALIKFFLCTSSSLCPLPLSSILCLFLPSSGHSPGLLRPFRCRLLPTLTLRTSRFLFLQSLIGFASCVFTAQYIGTWETLRGLALPSSITSWRAGHVYK